MEKRGASELGRACVPQSHAAAEHISPRCAFLLRAAQRRPLLSISKPDRVKSKPLQLTLMACFDISQEITFRPRKSQQFLVGTQRTFQTSQARESSEVSNPLCKPQRLPPEARRRPSIHSKWTKSSKWNITALLQERAAEAGRAKPSLAWALERKGRKEKG